MPMPLVPPRAAASAWRRERWCVILAGGDGTRLRDLTRLITGDDRPKQFCPLICNQTLLEQTLWRAMRSIPREQILFLLTGNHRAFYMQEQGVCPSQRIVQPMNKGTAPPILYSLLSIEANDADAIVTVMPCDHHYANERTFTDTLESAFEIAGQRSGSIVLLGAPPQGPEVEYGWIELGPSTGNPGGASFHVRGFCEKPSLHVARELFQRGSLWNTFVMVGRVRAFLEMLTITLRDLVQTFRQGRFWSGAEVHIPDSLYAQIRSADFSKEVLPKQTSRQVALRLGPGSWSDLGRPERVLSVLHAAGLEPQWLKDWQALRRPPSVAALAGVAAAVA